MAREKVVLGLFKEESQTVSVIESMKRFRCKILRVHSPFQSHRISDALRLKKSRVGYFTLAGGIFGLVSGFALAAFTAARWGLIVSGKPVIAWIPFLIVGFEFTVLFAVLGNVIGLVTQSRLPEYKGLEQYDPKFSGEHFGVVASCEEADQAGLFSLLRENGGEAKALDDG